MKKLIGIFAIASLLSFALMGCTPQAEGDTAPPEPTKGAGQTEPPAATPPSTDSK